jgi:hypothetical protein
MSNISISEDFDIDDEGSERNVEPLQSLHHDFVGYQCVHTRIDIAKKVLEC